MLYKPVCNPLKDETLWMVTCPLLPNPRPVILMPSSLLQSPPHSLCPLFLYPPSPPPPPPPPPPPSSLIVSTYGTLKT